MRLLGRNAIHLQHLGRTFVQSTAAHFCSVHGLHVAQAVEEGGPTRKLVKSGQLVPRGNTWLGHALPARGLAAGGRGAAAWQLAGTPARCAGAPSSEAS